MSPNIVFSSYECELHNKQVPIKIVRRIDNSDNGLVMHSHEFIELGIIISGEAVHVIDIPEDKTYRSDIKAGDVFLINQGESHCYYIEKEQTLEIVNILFDPSIISALPTLEGDIISPFDIIESLSIVLVRKKLGWALRLVENELLEVEIYIKLIQDEMTSKSVGYRMRVIMLLTVMLSLLSRKLDSDVGNSYKKEMSKSTDINKVISYIEHYYCSEIRLENLAKMGCCSLRHLTRKFKGIMGDSIVNYVNRLRVDRACFLILNTDLKIIEIATKTGFNEISLFNRVFLRVTGSTPSQFRKNYK